MNFRKPNRLNGYDYSKNGLYFVTICVRNRQHILWDNVGAAFGRLYEFNGLSIYGEIVDCEIKRIEKIYDEQVVIDKYVIMPNHVHAIIWLTGENRRPQAAPTISRLINQFKGKVSKQAGFSIWQRSFYDRIIRNEREYQEIWQYIDQNLLKWQEDSMFGE